MHNYDHTYTVVEKGHLTQALLVKTDCLLSKADSIFLEFLKISHCCIINTLMYICRCILNDVTQTLVILTTEWVTKFPLKPKF